MLDNDKLLEHLLFYQIRTNALLKCMFDLQIRICAALEKTNDKILADKFYEELDTEISEVQSFASYYVPFIRQSDEPPQKSDDGQSQS
jgi:hypothetical protein